MPKTHWVRGSILFIGLCAAQACGGSDSDSTSSTAVKSGLPASKLISELTESEIVELCEAEARAAQNAISDRDVCTFFAAVESITLGDDGSISNDQAACEQARDECLAAGAPAPACSSTATPAELQDCNISVGELETCESAQLRRASTLFKQVDCTTVPSLEDVETFDPDQPVPECEGFEERCPSLFSDGSEPSPTGCDNTCVFADDGECDDGGEGSTTDFCGFGTDCNDCGGRAMP